MHEYLKVQLQEFLSLNENWNGYGESPVHEEAIQQAVAVLDAITTKTTPQPDVVPTSEGGVQIEWSYGGIEIEVEVHPTGSTQILIADQSGKEYELSGSNSKVWELLQDNLETLGRELVDDRRGSDSRAGRI